MHGGEFWQICIVQVPSLNTYHFLPLVDKRQESFSTDFKELFTGDSLKNSCILGNAVTSQHGALLSDDIKALKTNR